MTMKSRANWTIQGIHQLHEFRFGGSQETAQFRTQWNAEMAALYQAAEESLYGLEHLSAAANSAISQMELQGIIRRPGNPPPGINPNSIAYNPDPAPAFISTAAAFRHRNAFRNPPPGGGDYGDNMDVDDENPAAEHNVPNAEPKITGRTALRRRRRRRNQRAREQTRLAANGIAGAVAHQFGSGAGNAGSSSSREWALE
jgi:hypothetical protein